MYLSPLLKKYPKADPDEPNWHRPVLGLMVVSLIFALLPFIYTGIYSRYQADDYCFASSRLQYGYFGALVDWYTLNSNRFSAMLTIGLIDPLQVIGMQILPGMLVTGMLGGLFLLINSLRNWMAWRIGKMEVFILAGMITFFTVYTAPQRFQSFYWRSGSVTYTLPVVLLGFILALLIWLDKQKLTGRRLAFASMGVFLITLFTGGFSETTAAFQSTIFGLIFLLAAWRSQREDKKRRLFLLGSTIAGLLAAMAIMILSPANAFRLSTMPETPTLVRLVYLSLRFGLGFIVNTLQESPLPLLASFLFAFSFALMGNWKDIQLRHWGWLFWAIPVSAFTLVVAICAPSAYGESAYPELRALLPARWTLTIAGIAWFYLLGMVYQNRMLKGLRYPLKITPKLIAMVIVLLCFYLMRAALVTVAEVPAYQTRAQDWDSRASNIEQQKAAGVMDLTVQALDSYGRIRELSSNPKLWVNRCAAIYYGVDRITAK
ncbi:MAG: hypothetical protein C0391_05520 [Anaerolinea sp.]|nr:hypothetical protein [Anaerolinea sp.]